MTLELKVPEKTIEILRTIAETDDWSFSNLVALSGLDPKVDFRFLDLSGFDFRGTDLRGYDLTGSDLRGCLRDKATIIDHTTIINDAQIEWIEINKPTIIEKMNEVELSSSSRERRKKLTELALEYQSADHIRRYLRNLIDQTRSVEAFFDYIDFFQSENSEDVVSIANGLRRFSNYSVRRDGKTKRYLNPSITSYRILLSRFSESSNEIASTVYNNYLKKLAKKGRETKIPVRAEADEDFILLLESIDELTEQNSFF